MQRCSMSIGTALAVLVLSGGCTKESSGDASSKSADASKNPSAAGKSIAQTNAVGGAKLSGRREAKLQFVYFLDTTPPSGGAGDVNLRVEPSANHEVSVGVMEEFAGGTGEQWRSAAWLAAINSSQVLGRSITDNEFGVRVGGRVDGPSAGMLITAGFAALLNGDPMRPDTTMTGTINPDGTAGPVGGIPQKLRGAQAKGLKRFGFPLGCRISRDYAKDEDVDLVELGRNLGMEMKEIRDIWEAYEFLTGKTMPREEPVSESLMQLSPDLRTTVRAKILNWKGQIDSQIPVIQMRYKELQAELKRFGRKGEGEKINARLEGIFAEAQAYQKSGQQWGQDHPGGYVYYVLSAVEFKLLSEEMDFLKPALNMDAEGVFNQVASVEGARSRVEALAMEMKVQSRRNSIGGRVMAVAGMAVYGKAWALVKMAELEVAKTKLILEKVKKGELQLRDEQVVAQVLASMEKPLLYYAAADLLVNQARELVGIGAEEGARASAELTDAESLGKAYASAAGAGLAYFDALVISQRAAQAGLSKEAAKQQLEHEDFALPILRILSGRSEEARTLFADDPAQMKLVQLAYGAEAYLGTAALVNKHYSLGTTRDEKGAEEVQKREALSYQIDIARQRAREAANGCLKKVGFIPAAALLDYQAGAAFSLGRTDAEKLQGLSHYWASTFWSDLAPQFVKK